MTMQGIAQITTKAGNITPERSTKAGDTAFETFMNKQAVQVSGKSEGRAGNTAANSNISNRSKYLSANRYNKDNSVSANNDSTGMKVKDPTSTNQSPEECGTDLKEVEEIVAQTMVILQEIFGLSEMELQDIMNQFSMEPQDLLLQMEGDQIVPVNTAAIQELILGIHGVDDTASFLTNDTLNQELTAVTEQISELLAENLGVSETELAKVETSFLSELAGQLEKLTEMTGAVDSSTMQMENQMVSEEDVTQAQQIEEPLTVVFETQEDAGDGDGGNEQMMTDHQPASQGTQDISPQTQATTVEVFKENLVQAFEEVRGTEGTSAESVMNQIVEQVVHHVRVRVMPETTSMELQLNPASLGRVNLTVATTAGAATATLVVENQMAKEALESQMIQLKETFAEQGLKVDAVEVTVAEFGLKKENEQQGEPSGGGRQNRRSHSGDRTVKEEESVADNVTAPDRRDAESTVDYTA